MTDIATQPAGGTGRAGLAGRTPPGLPGRTPPGLPGRTPPPARLALTKLAAVLAVSALPLLRPSGPGNTGLVDGGLLIAVLVTALWASGRRLTVRVPYGLPVGLLVVAGALSGMLAGGGLLALAQDVFVLLWAVAVTTLGKDPALLRTLTHAWARSAVCWAVVLIVAVVLHIDWLAGITARDGTRAALTFGDPNLAANYFLCSLLVLRAVRVPARRPARWLSIALIVTAMALTGSNGGALALLATTALGAVLHLTRRYGVAPALAASVAIVLGTAAVAPFVSLSDLTTRAKESVPLLRDSIGRTAESGGSRSVLAKESLRLWYAETPLGLGPGQTKHALAARQSPYVKEAHNDYTGTLVERGVLGAAAVMLLIGVLFVRCRRVAGRASLRPEYAAVVPRPELLVAAVAGMLLSGAFYELLHFRHVWALYGLVAALDLWGRE